MMKLYFRMMTAFAISFFLFSHFPSATETLSPDRERPGPTTRAAAKLLDSGASGVMKRVPLSFEENRGQIDHSVKFYSKGSGYSVFLTPTAVVLSTGVRYERGAQETVQNIGLVEPLQNLLRSRAGSKNRVSNPSALVMKLIGASGSPAVQGLDRLSARSSYLIGNNARQWQLDVPNYARVRYSGVYPGIDMVFYGRGRELEFDLEIAPGADPGRIKLEFEGTSGLRLDGQGNLVMAVSAGEVCLRKPLVYLLGSKVQEPIETDYRIEGMSRVCFSVGEYNRALPLTIDPILSYSTYLGGNGGDFGNGVAVDATGAIYIAGETFSTNFPLIDPVQGSLRNGFDVFVTKLNAAGSAIEYSTYLGGSADDYGRAIAVDSAGAVYITGWTNSPDFPVTASDSQFRFHGGADSFVTKLDPGGSALAYSLCLGGRGDDHGQGIVVDSTGTACVTGDTSSPDFPAVNAIQEALKGGTGDTDAFVTKVNPAGTAYVFSTYLGGINDDGGQGVAVDASGNVYVAGTTQSPDFPTVSALQPVYGGCCGSTYLRGDVFVTKLISTGTAFYYSTFLGGRNGDEVTGIAIDSSGAVYVTGCTDSANFPIANPVQQSIRGSIDGFVAKLDAAGASLVYSTYLGGSDNDFPRAIALDTSGSAYVAGFTRSSNFPTVNAFQASHARGLDDAFVTKLNPTGSELAYSGYLGGSSGDYAYGIAVDASARALVVGHTYSTDFPTINAYQHTHAGGSSGSITDVFIARIDSTVPAPSAATLVSPSGTIATAKPTFIWNAVNEATWYQLWANDSMNVNGKIKSWLTAAQAGCASGSGTCSAVSNLSLSSGPGQWWVQTYNDAGYGPWSEGMKFNVAVGGPAKPKEISPSGDVSIATPTYSWNAVPGATWYQLWVNDSTMASGKVKMWYTSSQTGCAGASSTCSMRPDTALAIGAARWWVQAWGASGYGQWSDGMSFNVVSAESAQTRPVPFSR